MATVPRFPVKTRCSTSLLFRTVTIQVVKRHLPSVRAYADDTQLYLAFKPDWVEPCVREIRAWMLCDKLEINDGKTEVIIIGA